MPKTVLLILLFIILLVIPVSAAPFVVAYGDPLEYTVSWNQTNTTEPFRVWIFGVTKGIYGIEGQTSHGGYIVSVPAEKILHLDEGSYDIYVQFPGANKQFDILYENDTLRTIYRAIPDTYMGMMPADKIRQQFNKYLNTTPVDDIVHIRNLTVELPSIKVKNMYTTEKEDLHIDLVTNLKYGDKVTAMIDEDVYGNLPAYKDIMSDSDVVLGEDERVFSLDFPNASSRQLTTGLHFITIHFLENGVTTIPIKRYSRYVEPTPTPELKYYYSFSGEMLGYDINTTRPAPTPTINITTEKSYDTALAKKRVDANNRTIDQRGIIYIGERNLDVSKTLGWISSYKGEYVYTVQFCEYTEYSDESDTDVVAVKDPEHYYVDPEIYSNRIGAWCQHKVGFYEKDPPVAFVVSNAVKVYNITDGNETRTNTTTTAVSENPTVSVTQTVPWEVTPITTEPTPVPTPAPTEAIVIPLPWWIAVAAIAIVVMRR